jgi:hypothetical protein
MAHASTREKGKLLMKKYRKAKAKKIQLLNSMPLEEREAASQLRREREEGEILEVMISDYNLKQLPKHKYPILRELCHKKEKEIYDKKLYEKAKAQLQRIKEVMQKLEVEHAGRKN